MKNHVGEGCYTWVPDICCFTGCIKCLSDKSPSGGPLAKRAKRSKRTSLTVSGGKVFPERKIHYMTLWLNDTHRIHKQLVSAPNIKTTQQRGTREIGKIQPVHVGLGRGLDLSRPMEATKTSVNGIPQRGLFHQKTTGLEDTRLVKKIQSWYSNLFNVKNQVTLKYLE